MILTVRDSYPDWCRVVVGYPGLPKLERDMNLGDALLYETPSDGVLEVRVTATDSNAVEFLVTQVSPRLGLIAGIIDEDPSNTPFSDAELKRIAESLASVMEQVKISESYPPEHLDLISRKLEEIQSASERLGRKDWINYVAGTITSTCIAAGFAPEVTKNIFKTIGVALSWLFNNAPVMLQLP